MQILTLIPFILFPFQYKLKSTAIVSTCSIGAFLGIGIYRNDEKFYDNCLMPLVRLCPPELCHRLAVIGFKYKIFPQQKEPDTKLLVRKILLANINIGNSFLLCRFFQFFLEYTIFELFTVKSDWNRCWIR